MHLDSAIILTKTRKREKEFNGVKVDSSNLATSFSLLNHDLVN
jgi:hypothetical protein